MQYRRIPRVRYCAIYLQLPFALHDTTGSFGTLVVPARTGSSDDGRAPVRIRIHAVPVDRPTVRSAAPGVAWAGSFNRPRLAEPLTHGMATLNNRADAVSGDRISVVQLVTRIPRGRITPAVSTELTEYAFRALNHFLAVYVVATEQADVRDVTFENLGPETTLGLRYTARGKNVRLMMLNVATPLPGELLPQSEHLLSMLPRLLQAEPQTHPIDLVRKLKVRAHRFADQGDFEMAIIMLQCSAERLVFALHEVLSVEKNQTRAQVTAAQPRTFKAALQGLSQSLGGNWSLQGNHPIGTYWTNLYEVRNRLVHAGTSADRDTTADAFDAYDKLWKHCQDRCIAVRSKHPCGADTPRWHRPHEGRCARRTHARVDCRHRDCRRLIQVLASCRREVRALVGHRRHHAQGVGPNRLPTSDLDVSHTRQAAGSRVESLPPSI